jgi:hypothetical protein
MVMMMTTATTTFTAVATPHALVLTVSHDLLFRQPPFAAALMPPFLFIDSLFSSLPFSPCVTQCCRLTAVNRRQMHPINPQRILSNRSPHPRLDRGVANPRYARDCSVQMRANR